MRKLLIAVVAGTMFPAVAQLHAADEAKPADPKAAAKITYDEHIQPIFREHCFTCHNQNEAKSDLALDSYGRTMQGGAGGEVVLAGDPDSSRLYALTAHLETPKMPPSQDRIAEAKVNLIKQWIVGGALENAGSKAKIKPKVNLQLATTTGNKPAGPAAMPEKFRRQPFVVSSRPGAATAMAASPWAPLVALAGQKQIMLHNFDTGELLTILAFPEGVAHVLKFSRDGSVLLAAGGRGGASGKVVLFDVKTGNRITEVGDELDVVLAADVSSDLSLVALGGPKKMVRVYAVADGSLQYEMKKHTDWIYAVEFSPDGILLATADRSAGLLVWESEGGREYQNLTGHTAAITDVSWRSDSNLLASCSEDGSIRLWEMENGKQVRTWAAHGGGATSVDFLMNGNLVTAGRDKVCKLWDLNGKQLVAGETLSDLALEAVGSYDGKRLLAADWAGDCRIFDATTGKTLRKLALNPPTLDVLVQQTAQYVVDTEKAAAAAVADAENAKKAAEAATAAAADAAKKAADTAAEVKRLDALRPELDKQVAAKQAEQRTASQKAAEARRPASEADAALNRSKLTAKQKAEAAAAAAAQSKKLGDELAKAVAEKKPEAPQLTKRLETAKADADAKSKQAAEAQQAVVAAEPKAKAAAAALVAAQEALKKIETDMAALVKQRSDAVASLNALRPQVKPLADAAPKVAASRDAAVKVAADKAAAAKLAVEMAAEAKQAAARAAADKAEFDKTGNAQASVQAK